LTDFFTEKHWNDFNEKFEYLKQFIDENSKSRNHEINQQNGLIRELLTTEFSDISVFMSVMPMTALRIDSHNDYVHYCAPSVIDQWVVSLFKVIHIIDMTSFLPSRNIEHDAIF
jgi:hypothetical protein